MRRTLADANLTKESLMDSALKLFLKNGYYHTSVDEIVYTVGLSRGAFYGHFEDKEDLFGRMLQKELNFISDLIAHSFVSHDEEKIQLEQLLLNILNNFYSNKRFRDFIELTWFRVDTPLYKKIISDKTDFNEFLIEEIIKILTRASNKKKIADNSTPKNIAISLAAMLTGIYRLYFITPNYLCDHDVAKTIVLDYLDNLFITSPLINHSF